MYVIGHDNKAVEYEAAFIAMRTHYAMRPHEWGTRQS